MSVLSPQAQKQVEESLLKEKLVTAELLDELKVRSEGESVPFMSLVAATGGVSPEVLTRIVAQATKVPYVNLSASIIDPKILELLPAEVAERYMSVPLGEMQNRLVVAMLDADNVQAVDFLSNKIGRPLKVYTASEEGIRSVLKQYKHDIGEDVMGAFSSSVISTESFLGDMPTADDKTKAKNIKTIVQD